MAWLKTALSLVTSAVSFDSPNGVINSAEYDDLDIEFDFSVDTEGANSWLYFINDYTLTGALLRLRIQAGGGVVYLTMDQRDASYTESNVFGPVAPSYTIGTTIRIRIRRSSSSLLTLYVNGTQVGSGTHSATIPLIHGMLHFGNTSPGSVTAISRVIVNYSVTPPQYSVASGTTRLSAGKQKGDLGIILFGDSNMVGSGAGALQTHDDIRPCVHQLSRIAPTDGQIIQSDLSWSSYLEFTTSAIFDGPGPGYFFIKELIKLGQSQGRRIVGLPCARWGSGFYWGDWPIGGPRYVVMQELVDDFLALNSDNRILCAAGTIGVNDRAVQTPAEIYDDIEIFINSIRSTAFVGNAAQPSFTNLPIIWLGGSTEYAASSPAFQAVLDMFATLEANFSNLKYVPFDGLSSEGSDNIHLSGFSNRVLGQWMVDALDDLGGLPL